MGHQRSDAESQDEVGKVQAIGRGTSEAVDIDILGHGTKGDSVRKVADDVENEELDLLREVEAMGRRVC